MHFHRREFLASLLTVPAWAQEKTAAPAYPPQMDGAQVETYKTIDGVKLNLWLFRPAGHTASDKRAAIVFFFGGGWTGGNPNQFETQCRHLASRGMVAITADYRVKSRHGVAVADCVRDAKSAVRWVRSNAARLGIDPNRIAAGGGSAGGHLAAATGVLDGFEENGENPTVSSRPNALVLFNPVLIFPPAPEANFDVRQNSGADIAARLGPEPQAISPYHHVKKGAPPTIIFHGRADTTVPYKTAEAFAQKMTAMGNRCELEGYEGQVHGFFNYGRGGNTYYAATLERADVFLASLHYLK